MTARTLTGLLLIVSTIVTLIGFMGLGISLGNLDFGDTQGTIASFGENPATVKTFISIGTLGLLMSVLGYAGLSDSMGGGSGSHYTKIGLILYSIGTIVVVGESAMYIGTAEAASKGAQATSGALFATGLALGGAGVAISMLGLAVIGVGICVQKYLNQILGCLMFIVGIVGLIIAVADYTSPLITIAYIGSLVVTIAVGILYLRSES